MWSQVNGIQFWQDDALAESGGVVHGFVTRTVPDSDSAGPHSGAKESLPRALAALGLAERCLVEAEQVHGAEVGVVDEEWSERARGDGCIVPGVDALITRRDDVCLSLHFADCVPVFVTDQAGSFVGLAHAGWRGLAAGIPGQVVAALAREYRVRPAHLRVALGPAIGPCCYEVGEDVVALLAGRSGPTEQWLRTRAGRPYVDLRAVARGQLVAAGVPGESISADEHCTACEPGRFASYRRDGDAAGRMTAVMARALARS